MARAKKVSKAADDEHMELEAAMSELSRQTDALLAEAKPKKQVKPTLPQKKIIPHSKGASLDIVGHAPSSIHRSSKVSQVKKTETKEELLPEHAGLSFNEKPADAKTAPSEVKPVTNIQQDVKPSPKIIGNQQTRDSGPASSASSESISVIDADSEISESVSVKHETTETSKLPNESVQKDVAPKAEAVEPPKEVDLNSDDKAEPKTAEKAESTTEKNDDLVIKTETADETSAEADDDGIVKLEDEPKEKADVFDVEEYQAELHDWSKLASNSHWPVIVLVFLLVLAGGIMYLYFTNNLPKIL